MLKSSSTTASSVLTRPTSAWVSAVAAVAPVFGEYRDEGLRERAFGKQSPQDVRQPERRLERVHLHPGAERRRLDGLADESR